MGRNRFEAKQIVFVVLALLLTMCLVSQTAAARAWKQVTIEGIAAYNSGYYDLAFHLLQSGADLGDSDAEVNLGYMYARGQGTRVDQAEALRLYRLSADQGNGEGMNALAYKYTFGTGVPVDMKAAMRWYCQAITLGNPRALTNLGLLLAQGTGVTPDMDEARNLWRQAAETGHVNAMFDLGISLAQPDPQTMPLVETPEQREGKTWIIRAAEGGQPAAIRWLRNNGYSGALPEPVDQTNAMVLPLQKAISGSSKACRT